LEWVLASYAIQQVYCFVLYKVEVEKT
jgi:hypothetical protein